MITVRKPTAWVNSARLRETCPAPKISADPEMFNGSMITVNSPAGICRGVRTLLIFSIEISPGKRPMMPLSSTRAWVVAAACGSKAVTNQALCCPCRASRNPAITSADCFSPGSTHSTSTSTCPPQIASIEAASLPLNWKPSTSARRSRITRAASACTFASRIPPPTVPAIPPSCRTSIFAPVERGAEPLRSITVARANISPFFTSVCISLNNCIICNLSHIKTVDAAKSIIHPRL